jgi:hypothetical protein
MTRNRLLYTRLTGASRRVRARIHLHEYARPLLSWTLRPRWRHKRLHRQAMLRAIADDFLGRYGPPPGGVAALDAAASATTSA